MNFEQASVNSTPSAILCLVKQEPRFRNKTGFSKWVRGSSVDALIGYAVWQSTHLPSGTIAGVRSNIQKPSGKPMTVTHSAQASSSHSLLAHQPTSTK